MSEDAGSSRWAHVARLSPALRAHVRIHPQDYRGQRWYVLRDESNGRVLRLSAPAYEVVRRLDGETRMDDIWHELEAQRDVDSPTQDEIVALLAQLLATEVLRGGMPSNVTRYLGRVRRNEPSRWQTALLNPLAVRVPLIDPDRLLTRVLPWVRPAFGWLGALVWLAVVGTGAVLALGSLPELSAAVSAEVLVASNVAVMLLLFSLLKALHEFGHALTVKLWGGEVHEMGITLLVLTPVPYVDASAAWVLRDKRKRAMVAAAGVAVELFVAAIALFVWLMVEPGFVRTAALDLFLIGSLSTLLFNANPLMRFDGYYVLQDLIEIPNLSPRSSRYLRYLAARYLLGLEDEVSPAVARGERAWLLGYGVAALAYRLVVVVGIALFLAQVYLALGVALALWVLATQVVWPIVRGMRFLLSSPRLAGTRVRGLAMVTAAACAVAIPIAVVPVPLTTYSEGVVRAPDHSRVVAGSDGFVDEVVAVPGGQVEKGDVLLRLRAPDLDSRIAVLRARVAELEFHVAAERVRDRAKAAVTEQALASAHAELALARQRSAALVLRSPARGEFVALDPDRLAGRWLEQGEAVGYVFGPGELVVSAVVPQSDIGLVRRHTERVVVRLAERVDETVPVQVLRQTPLGSQHLPSAALGAAGGGTIAVDTRDASGTTASEAVFQVDLRLPEGFTPTGVGGRAYVRFDHGGEPLATQWWRRARQLVLGRLAV